MFEDDFENGFDQENNLEIARHVKEIIRLLGENVDRPGLKDTPLRAARGLKFFTMGLHQENRVEEILNSALFTNNYNEMVLVKDIDFYSLCEHHLLPIYGKVHIAYIPNGKVLGLSKIPRIVDVYARRLQIQEQMTIQIRDAIDTHLKPQGTAVLIEGNHMCMMSRGIQKIHSKTITSALSGKFLEDEKTRDEFINLIK